MPGYYDGSDLLWTDDGDLHRGREGDIASTDFDALLAIFQDIYDRAKSDAGDYSETPYIGATLSDYVGEPNTRETGAAIQRALYTAMRAGGYIDVGDISINVFPVSPDAVSVRMEMRVQPTSWNQNSRIVEVEFTYNFAENHIYPHNSPFGETS